MLQSKLIVAGIASAMMATVVFLPPQFAHSESKPQTTYEKSMAEFTAMQENKFCSKISTLDNLIAKHGSQNLLLKSKEAGQSPDLQLLVYYDPKGKRFTIVKTYAKKNQACIVMSGYDVKLEPGITNPSVEDKGPE